MTLTRKHFKAIAQALRDERDHWYESRPDRYLDATDALDAVAERLAGVLAHENSNFDRERFLAACGHQTSKSD
jgi:hypothetical protein